MTSSTWTVSGTRDKQRCLFRMRIISDEVVPLQSYLLSVAESSTSQLEAMTAHCAATSETGREHGAGAHPQASKWVAAFRYVYIQPKAKFIFVDFVGAPPQYCFEEYELRLLRNFYEIVDFTRIRREDLHHEMHGNVTVSFGNYTFHNVTPGIYELGVSEMWSLGD